MLKTSKPHLTALAIVTFLGTGMYLAGQRLAACISTAWHVLSAGELRHGALTTGTLALFGGSSAVATRPLRVTRLLASMVAT